MAGYSQKPLPSKLGIKTGQTIKIVNPPPDWDRVIGQWPTDVQSAKHNQLADCDVIIAFFERQKELLSSLPKLIKRLKPSGGLWLAWPKKASNVPTDLNENMIREAALAAGLVDNKVCAISDIWSGLRIVYRLHDRSK